ncbi:hypothetical protein CGRA01v4_10444 [Colletotrichum graminicola]|nr:hypothetical protein CGRA01v4_10444 [Colletotrichum graminicola]
MNVSGSRKSFLTVLLARQSQEIDCLRGRWLSYRMPSRSNRHFFDSNGVRKFSRALMNPPTNIHGVDPFECWSIQLVTDLQDHRWTQP